MYADINMEAKKDEERIAVIFFSAVAMSGSTLWARVRFSIIKDIKKVGCH